jgi:hypothetical protein
VTILVWLAFALMAVGAVLGRLSFQKVVEIEFTDFHDHWVKDGKPVGGPKSRRSASFWRSGFATSHVSQDWLFMTPEWARTSPEVPALLRRYRFWMAVMALGILGVGAMIILFTG